MSFLRLPRFIRRYIRRTTNRIPEDRAGLFKSRLSLGYAFCAWNLFGLLFYTFYNGHFKIAEDSSLSQGRQFVKLFKMENVHLYHIDNMKSVKHSDLNEEFPKVSQKTAASTTEGDQ